MNLSVREQIHLAMCSQYATMTLLGRIATAEDVGHAREI